MKFKDAFFFLWLFAAQTGAHVHAQDFLVERFLATVVFTHPSVLAVRSELNAADTELTAAWQQLLPELQATTSNPTNRKVTDPLVTQPKSTVAVEQKLWAGGKLTSTIEVAEMAQKSAQAKLAEARLNIALSAVESLQAYRSAAERLRINEQTVQRLGRFESMMVRRVGSGVSAPIDATLVRSRMLQAQVDKSNAEAAQRLALSRLQQLSVGTYVHWPSLTVQSLGPSLDTRLSKDPVAAWQALEARVEQHPSVQRYQAEAQVARARQGVLSAEQFPVVYARLEQNHYDNKSDYYKTREGAVGYIGLRFVPGAGFATLSQSRAAADRALSAEGQAQASRREITNQLRQDYEEWRSASDRLADYAIAEKNSAAVSESYERQFIVGRLSWQQTLDAVREHGQISQSLADTEASVWGASYRLRLRSGDYDAVLNEVTP